MAAGSGTSFESVRRPATVVGYPPFVCIAGLAAATRLVGDSFTFSGELAALSSGITYPQGSEQQLNSAGRIRHKAWSDRQVNPLSGSFGIVPVSV